MTAPRDILGARAKIGALVPFTNTIVQPEFEAMAPPGVTNHIARIPNRPRPMDDMDAYAAILAEGAVGTEDVLDRVTPAAPDLILLGHSVDSFLSGVAGATALQTRLSAHAGLPVLVPSLALVAALEALGRPLRLGVLTPYMPPADAEVRRFLTGAGFEVVRLTGLKCPTPLAIAATTPGEIKAALVALDGPDIDALVQAGTNLPMARLAAAAETFLAKPVVSINTATYWHGLRTLGINDRMHGFGALMADH